MYVLIAPCTQLESHITPEIFADILCEDLQAPPQHFHHQIVKAIKEQLADFQSHAPSAIEPIDPQGQGNDFNDNSSLDAAELRTIIKVSAIFRMVI